MAGPRRTRQQRLVDDGAVPPLANFQIVRKPLLSASTLASWLGCHTKPFVERVLQVLGVDASTMAMHRGAQAHLELQGALESVAAPSELTLKEALARKEFLFETETHLLDERRRMHGYVDIIYAREGRLHILELKNTRGPKETSPQWGAAVWPEHGMQLHFYGILGRTQYGVTPQLGLTYMQGGSKEAALEEVAASRDPAPALERLTRDSVALPHTAAERLQVLTEVSGFQRAEKGVAIPEPNHMDPRKCAHCNVRAWCPKRLDQPGRFLELDAALLEEAG